MNKILIFSAILALASSCTAITPGMATGNLAEKKVTIKKKVFLGLTFKPIDLSLATAAEKGDITKIATVDFAVKKGFFTTYSIIVTGN